MTKKYSLEELDKYNLIEYFDELLNKIEKSKLEQDITELEISIQSYRNDIENLNEENITESYNVPKKEKYHIKHKLTLIDKALKKIFSKENDTSRKNNKKIKKETTEEKRKRLLKEKEDKLGKMLNNLEEKKSKLEYFKSKKEIYNSLNIDSKYKNKKVISEFKSYLENGECNNYNECVAIYEKNISNMQIARKINEKEQAKKIIEEEEKKKQKNDKFIKEYEEKLRQEKKKDDYYRNISFVEYDSPMLADILFRGSEGECYDLICKIYIKQNNLDSLSFENNKNHIKYMRVNNVSDVIDINKIKNYKETDEFYLIRFSDYYSYEALSILNYFKNTIMIKKASRYYD